MADGPFINDVALIWTFHDPLPPQSVTSFMTYQISSIVEEHVRLKLDPGRVVVEHQVAAGIANLRSKLL